MKKVIAIVILLCAIACQSQEPTYIPASDIEHYYIEKQERPEYRINLVHIDPNCKDDLYFCPAVFLEKETHWALCTKCVHPDTAKEIQSKK